MDLLLNDLSIEGQFPSLAEFLEAVRRIREMRRIVEKSGSAVAEPDSAPGLGHRLYCHRNTVNRHIDADASITVYKALQTFTRDDKVSLLAWLTKGPFLEDALEHSPGLWLEVDGEIVTETAVGEAAHCSTLGLDRRLVSLAPSQWERSPVTVTMLLDDGTTNIPIPVENYWTPADLETALQAAEPPISDWPRLEVVCRAKFQLLHFSAECFRHLDGLSFVPAAANRIISLLEILDQLMGAADDQGQHPSERNRLLREHFNGARAWFSDSSDTEKREFEQKLTFPHPDKPGEYLFCPWHGKVNQPPFRIHFSWPESDGEPLYVVYVGEKRTKK